MILGRTSPKNWTKQTVEGALSQFSSGNRATVITAVKQIRPELGLNARGLWETKQTKEKRELVSQEVRKLIDNPQNLKLFLDSGNLLEREFKYTHVTTGAREGYNSEGGILNLDWKFYDSTNDIIKFYESKTEDIWIAPLRLFGDTCAQLIKDKWLREGQPKEGKIFPISAQALYQIYKNASQSCGLTIKPHMADKIHLSLLAKHDIPLEDASSGQLGRGWKNIENARKFYLVFSSVKLTEDLQKSQKVGL